MNIFDKLYQDNSVIIEFVEAVGVDCSRCCFCGIKFNGQCPFKCSWADRDDEKSGYYVVKNVDKDKLKQDGFKIDLADRILDELKDNNEAKLSFVNDETVSCKKCIVYDLVDDILNFKCPVNCTPGLRKDNKNGYFKIESFDSIIEKIKIINNAIYVNDDKSLESIGKIFSECLTFPSRFIIDDYDFNMNTVYNPETYFRTGMKVLFANGNYGDVVVSSKNPSYIVEICLLHDTEYHYTLYIEHYNQFMEHLHNESKNIQRVYKDDNLVFMRCTKYIEVIDNRDGEVQRFKVDDEMFGAIMNKVKELICEK